MAGADFWSRRRAGVAAEAASEEAEAREVAAAEAAARRAAAEAEKTDEELLAELGLPDPDSLKAGDDFSVFMARAVPTRLRNRALRTLWGSNPVLANLDGMVDYADDFTDAATVLPDMQTAYQVGKGMLKHIEALAAEAEEIAQEETGDDPFEPAQDPVVHAADAETEILAETPTRPITSDTRTAPEEEVAHAAPRRHMRFTFAVNH